MQKAYLSFIAIASAKGNDYAIHFWYMSKEEAINITKDFDFLKKVEFYKIIKMC